MKQDEIIEMARQAGLRRFGPLNIDPELEAFAKLVAAKEQKEMIDLVVFYGGNVYDIQTAIRARGEA
jgi:hypothetical protein